MDKTTGDQLRSPRDRVMKPEVLKQELYRDEMMATLGRMAGGMAHEFTSPLQAIKFIAQSTERFLEKNKISPQEIKGNLKRIVRVVDLMAGQVDHIKALARHDHLKTGPIELNLIIKSAFEFFEQQLKTRGITVKFNLQEIVSDLEGTIRLYDKTQPGTGIYIEIPVVKEV